MLTLEILTQIAIAGVTIPLTLFVLFYGLKSDWRASRLGIFLLATMTVVLAFAVWLSVTAWLPLSTFLLVVKGVILIAANICFWGLFCILRSLQKHAENNYKGDRNV